MYQALYRKYRPKRFSDVAGQEHITETLRGQIETGRLTHAYLFVGTRGTGKTTCAKILSRAVNCQNPAGGDPCNKCPSCIGIEDGTILDVLELDGASNNKVEDARELRNEAIYSPAAVKKRVYIIDEVHMLTRDAFNALLKILEEPPGHIIFILATTELHKVLPTIQSRCQKFMFRRLSPEVIAARLAGIAAGEGLDLTPDAAEKLAILADGSMRDGISLLDQCVTDEKIDEQYVRRTLGLASQQELLDMIDKVAKGSVTGVLQILDSLYKDGKDMAAMLGELSNILRDLLLVKLAADTALISSGLSPAELMDASGQLSAERLFYCLDIAKDVLMGMPRTGISKTILEMCLIKMTNDKVSGSPAALASRIEALENQASPINQHQSSISAFTCESTAKQPTITETAPEPGIATLTPGPVLTPVRADIPDTVIPEQITQPQKEDYSQPDDSALAVSGEDTLSYENTALLGRIRSVITDMTLGYILSDSSMVSVEIKNGILLFKMADEQDADYMKKNLTDVQEAVRKITGNETAVRIEMSEKK